MTEQKIETYMGLCRAAGGVVTGFDLVLGEVRRRRAVFVLIADDASERTRKQLTDKCNYYKVKYFPTQPGTGFTAEELAHIVGRKSACAAAAFTGKGPCRPLLTLLEERAKQANGNAHENQHENAAMTERMIVDGNKADVDV